MSNTTEQEEGLLSVTTEPGNEFFFLHLWIFVSDFRRGSSDTKLNCQICSDSLDISDTADLIKLGVVQACKPCMEVFFYLADIGFSPEALERLISTHVIDLSEI